jgi:hypothetical protein
MNNIPPDIALIVALAALGVSVLTMVSYFRRAGARDEALKREAKAARDAAESASTIAGAAIAKLDLLRQSFNDYKVEVARDMAHVSASAEDTARALIAAENRLIDAIKEMAKRFDGMTDRFDQLLLRRSGRSTT